MQGGIWNVVILCGITMASGLAQAAADQFLRIDDDVQAIGPGLTLPDATRNRTLILLDEDHRVVDVKRWPPTLESVAKMSPRNFRVGLFLGDSEGERAASRAMLLSRSRGSASIDVAYQPGAWGTVLGYEVRSQKTQGDEIAATYRSTAVRLGVSRCFVPFAEDGWIASRFHVDVQAGAIKTMHQLSLADDSTSKSTGAAAIGPFAGADLRYAIVGNFWPTLRYQVAIEDVNFSALGIHVKDTQQLIAIGMEYAL